MYTTIKLLLSVIYFDSLLYLLRLYLINQKYSKKVKMLK